MNTHDLLELSVYNLIPNLTNHFILSQCAYYHSVAMLKAKIDMLVGIVFFRFYSRSVAIPLGLLVSFALSFGIISSTLQQAFGISDFNILSVGNWACTSNSQATVNNIKNKDPELVLGLGDYSYQSTAKCWFNKIKPFDGKTKINIRNHDDEAKKLLNSYLVHFGLSKQYYSFDFQNVHVLTMATELKYKSGSKHYNFVKNDLEQASQNPNIKWIIVNMHKPVYTSPNGCSASSCDGSKTLIDVYHPLFDKYGVDLVLNAHVHTYHRFFPIKYNADKPI